MIADVDEVTGLPALLDALISAVSTLEAVGADGVCDVRLFASGCRGGQRTSDLRLEGEQLSVLPIRSPGIGDAVGESGSGDRLSIMLAEFCFVGWAWQWTLEELADTAGCTEGALADWLERAGRDQLDRLPIEVESAVRRVLIVDHQRRLLGIEDDDAPAWVLAPRAELEGHSVAVLLSDGARHFHLVQRMLCASPPEAQVVTLH